MPVKLNRDEVKLLLPKAKLSKITKAPKRPQAIDECSFVLKNGLSLAIEFKGCNTELLLVNAKGAFYIGSAILSFKDMTRFNRQKAAFKAFQKMLQDEDLKKHNILSNDDKIEIVDLIFMNIPNITYDLTSYER